MTVVVATFVIKDGGRFCQTQVVWLGLGKVVWRTFESMCVVATLKHVVTVRFCRVVGYFVVVRLEKIVTVFCVSKLQF